MRIILIIFIVCIVGCGKSSYSETHPENIEKYKLVKSILAKKFSHKKRVASVIKLISLAWDKPIEKVCLYDGGIERGTYFLLFKYLREYKQTGEEEFYTKRFKDSYFEVIKFINKNFSFAKIVTTNELKILTKKKSKIKLAWTKDKNTVLYLQIIKNKYSLSNK